MDELKNSNTEAVDEIQYIVIKLGGEQYHKSFM